MANASPQAVKELRELTGLGMMECKKILEETGGNLEKAKELCAKRGQDRAQKVAGRTASEGTVDCYIHHNGKVGVLLELNCNTDFVARNPEFSKLARELAMHVAAMSPQVVQREDLDPELVASLREHYGKDVPKNKPQEIIDKIVDGKMQSWYAERVLLDQPFAMDTTKTVRKLIEEKIATTKENIRVARFVRFQVGETASKAAPEE